MAAKWFVKFVWVTGIASVLAGCGVQPTAKVTGVKMGQFSSQAAQLIFDVAVDNPYGMALPMTGADYALSTQGQRFLSGEADMQGMIPAGASKTVQLPVDVNFMDLFKTVQGVKGKSEIPYTADMGLFVNTPVINKKLRLPLKKDGILKLPTAEDILKRADQLNKLRNFLPK